MKAWLMGLSTALGVDSKGKASAASFVGGCKERTMTCAAAL